VTQGLNDLTPDELHSRVYAIGVGTPENIQPASLAQLVGQQDGYLLMTGNIDANDTFLLTKYFQQILAGITNSQIVVDPQGFVTPGATLRLPFPVNETDREIDVIVHSPAPWLLDFQVETPDGQIFGPPLAVGPGAQFVVGAGTAFYRLSLPSPIVGPQDPTASWYARLRLDREKWGERSRSWYSKQPEVAGSLKLKTDQWTQWAHRLRYAFTTQARSTLRMEIAVTQSDREPGARAWLRASLTEYGFPLEVPAEVTAVITRPDTGGLDLPLSETGDGVYEGSFTTDAAGAWRVAVHASGKTSHGSPFKREALRSVTVWSGGNRPGPSTPTKSPIEQLLACLCNSDILDPKVAKKLGLNKEALCRCLRDHSSK
jgi:hypothetical protein